MVSKSSNIVIDNFHDEMGKFVAEGASDVPGRIFEPLIFTDGYESSAVHYGEPLSKIVRILMELDTANKDNRFGKGVRPFAALSETLQELMEVGTPNTRKQFAESKWQAEIEGLLEMLEDHIKAKGLTRHKAFVPLILQIGAYRSAIQSAESIWKEHDNWDVKTLLQLIVGPAVEVDKFILKFAEIVSKFRTDNAIQVDEILWKRPDLCHLLAIPGVGSGVKLAHIDDRKNELFGEVSQLHTLDFRSDDHPTDVPDLEVFFNSLNTISETSYNTPGEVFRTADRYFKQLYEEVKNHGVSGYLRSQDMIKRLIQIISDLEQVLKGIDVSVPKSSRLILEGALALVKPELTKLQNQKEAEGYVVQTLAIPIMGTKNLVEAALQEFTDLGKNNPPGS